MSITTELLVALWFTVLPAQQIVRGTPPPVNPPACADAVPVGSANASQEPPVVDARLETVEVLHEGDRRGQLAIRATCPVNARCRVPGLVARQVAFEVESIRWTAGSGWPEYRHASPRDDRSAAMLYPDALVHQLVIAIGANGFTACPAAAVARATTAGEISFLVNDDKYDDNEGTFAVLIESWRQ